MNEYTTANPNTTMPTSEGLQPRFSSNQEQVPESHQAETISFEHTKGFHPFYIFPLLYVLSIYLLPAYMSIALKVESVNLTWLVFLPFVFGILNIIAAVKFCRPENRILMLNATVLIKYSMIPFYMVYTFMIICLLFMAFIPVPFMIFITLTIPWFIIYEWFVLAFEAPYAISYLRLSFKSNTCSIVMMIVHAILQFLFFVDVIDVMFLALRARKWKKLTITLIILGIIFALLLFILIAWMVVRFILSKS